MNDQRDEELWKIAKKRASFQRGLAAFFIINAFFWAIWWFTQGRSDHEGVPWPVWVMLGWGIGLGFKYLDAYGGSKEDLQKKEYDKLKNKENP